MDIWGWGGEEDSRVDIYEQINRCGSSRKHKEQEGTGTGWGRPDGWCPVKNRLHYPMRFKLI